MAGSRALHPEDENMECTAPGFCRWLRRLAATAGCGKSLREIQPQMQNHLTPRASSGFLFNRPPIPDSMSDLRYVRSKPPSKTGEVFSRKIIYSTRSGNVKTICTCDGKNYIIYRLHADQAYCILIIYSGDRWKKVCNLLGKLTGKHTIAHHR